MEDEGSVDAHSDAIEVELNFNAFADHVPPTQHAKRVATHFDPSIQDFADQALEVAALRAELNRLSRECDALRGTIRRRESQVQTLREQLSSLRTSAPAAQDNAVTPSMTPEGMPASPPVATTPNVDAISAPEHATRSLLEASMAHGAPAEPDGSSTVVLDTSPSAGRAAAIRSTCEMRESGASASAPERQLLPEGHEGEAIRLNRDIITIGRTRRSDICIPSHAVSRDHARLLVGATSVTLVDIGSANGCFVNDELIKRHKLRDGDLVRIGDRSYRFADSARERSPA